MHRTKSVKLLSRKVLFINKAIDNRTIETVKK